MGTRWGFAGGHFCVEGKHELRRARETWGPRSPKAGPPGARVPVRLRGSWARGRLGELCSILKIWPVPQSWATRGFDSHRAYEKISLRRKQQEQMIVPETTQRKRPCWKYIFRVR